MHSLSPPASPIHPAQNLAPLSGENKGPAQGHVVKKSEAGTISIHFLQDTSAQESLIKVN